MDKITQSFMELEKEKGLFKRKYCGIPYWQGIRLKIGWTITGIMATNETVSDTRKGKWRKRSRLYKDFIKDFLNYCCLKKCDILYFDGGMEGAYRNVDGKQVDVYFGYFGYEDKYQVERCYHIKGNKRNPLKPGIGVDLILPYKLMVKIQSLLNPQKRFDLKEDAFLHILCDEISKKYNKKISADTVIKDIRYNCELHIIYEKYYRKLLKKTVPKVIILKCHYGTAFYPLYKIAKEFSIPVIELQHGHVCNHLAYNYLDTSNEGKELPDYLFTYGDFWNEQIQLPMGTKIVSVGSPFLEAMKVKYKNDTPDERAIVFYSGTFSADGEELEKLAADFYNKYKDKGYKIYFKFHPGEASAWKNKYRILSESKGIQIVDPKLNIYQMFARAKHHVSVMSTVMYEAVSFDICRYIYRFEGLKEDLLKICAPLVENGGAEKFSNVQELESLINKKTNTEVNFADRMWKHGAKENGQKALKEIIDHR